jgi:predicted CXXCH cytochrome family protein
MIGKYISRVVNRLIPAFLLFLLLIVLPAMIFEACTSPKYYKTMSVFIDGVPNPTPSAVAVQKDTAAGNSGHAADGRKNVGKTAGQMTVHPPYKQKKCEACHDRGDMGKTLNRHANTCYQCHDDFSKQFNRLHGPVGAGYCSVCHNPHYSDNAKLLKRPGQQLCLYCHNATELERVEIHRMVGDGKCTECHNPHGGSDGTFLK